MTRHLLTGLAYVVAAVEHLLRPPPPTEVPLFDLMDADDRPHPEPCIDPVWAVLDGDRRLSLVPMSDGHVAVFAATCEDFVGLQLDRSQVQQLRLALTEWLVGTARTVSL